jgi:hypothetical protein
MQHRNTSSSDAFGGARWCFAPPLLVLRCFQFCAILKCSMVCEFLKISGARGGHREVIADAVQVQFLGFLRLQNRLSKNCHEMGLESSSGAGDTTKMHSKRKKPDASGQVSGPELGCEI